MNRLILMAAAFIMLVAPSCRLHSEKQTTSAQAVQLEDVAPPVGTVDTATVPDNKKYEENRGQATSVATTSVWDKKLVRNGTLTIEADDYAQFDKNIRQAVGQWGGYIASEKEASTDYKKENVVTIKVPVRYFDDAMQQLSATKGKVIDKEISTADVTAEFVDTRARMEAKKQIRLRYVDILQKAKNVEDVLQVEKEINAMQEEVEAAEGRMNYLQHAAAYSTIQLTFYQIVNAGSAKDTPPGFAQRIWTALSDGAKGASDLLVTLLTLWPLWMMILLILWLARRATAMRSKARLAAAK